MLNSPIDPRTMRVRRSNSTGAISSILPCNNYWLAVRSTSVLVLGIVLLCWINLTLPLFILTNESTTSSSATTTRINHLDVSSPTKIINHHRRDNSMPTIISPACRPHFRLALPDGTWTTSTKFTRLYFYHVRKAGGTTLRRYLQKVAAHHGLKYKVWEYGMAEDPGSYDEATLYVTHVREPVSRSISHFKYEGRWNCTDMMYNESFVPSEENALKLETWNKEYGHHPAYCYNAPEFRMSQCAVNCYSQWFAGSCPEWDTPEHPGGPGRMPILREMPMVEQYNIARAKMLKYNLIVVTEMLKHPNYVAAIERYFGVPGVNDRTAHPWCEDESHYYNSQVPLVIHNETVNKLTALNKIDIGLYHEFSDCLKYEGVNNIPAWDDNRFMANESIRIHHSVWNVPMSQLQ